eukprot:3213211-Rhodomonas_salina.1
MQVLAHRLGVEAHDTYYMWNIGGNGSLFPAENETDREFIYLKYFDNWIPSDSFDYQLFMHGLKQPQIAMLLSMMDNHNVFEAHLHQYLQVCHVPYSEWCKTFQTANKRAPLVCLKRVYWCYLTMQLDLYNSEILVLTRSQTEICKHYQNQSGLFIRQWHRPALYSIVWQYGVDAGTNFVEGKL